MAADFTRWGYPPWFAQLTAVLQLVGGVLLLWPASVVWGAALLTCVLLAVATHLKHDPPAAAMAALVFSVPVVTLLLVHRPRGQPN